MVLTVSATAVDGGRATGRREVPGRRDRAAIPAWIEERRQIVDKATGGKIGYIYVQSTGTDAQNELMRQFMAQWKKDGLIIDERWNSGGQIPDRFIELLEPPDPRLLGGARRPEPAVAAGRAPRAAGHADQRLERLGRRRVPVLLPRRRVSARSSARGRGAVSSASAARPTLADGGAVTVPTFRMYDPKGQWFAEGHGVEPDIAVDDDPAQLAEGNRSAARTRDQRSDRACGESAESARASGLRKADPSGAR